MQDILLKVWLGIKIRSAMLPIVEITVVATGLIGGGVMSELHFWPENRFF